MQTPALPRTLPSAGLDWFGAAVASACGLHCLVTPWLLALLPVSSLRFLADERTEWALLTVALLSGLASLVPSYIRHHHRGAALWWFATGSLLLLGVNLSLDESVVDSMLVALAGLALFAGHRVNARLCRDCVICDEASDRRRNCLRG
jgi:MerC mercury resistance protein